MIKKTLTAIALYLSTTQFIYADAPIANIGGDVVNEIALRGAILNAGLSVGGLKGGDVEMEVSVGTVHGNSVISGSLTNQILIDGLLGGISIVNAGLSWQGTLCVKTSVGSIGASTCTYDEQ